MADRTITLPAETVERLEALAKQRGYSVDDMLVDWLERTAPASQSDWMLEAMAADPDIQREIKQIQADSDSSQSE